MLRKLFNRKPRLDAENSADRIAALATLEDVEQETFARAFEEDPDRDVRLSALARLTQPETLVKALDDAEFGGEVLSRLLAVIDDDTPESIRHHPAVLDATLSRAEEPEEAVRVATAMDDKAALAAALGKNPSRGHSTGGGRGDMGAAVSDRVGKIQPRPGQVGTPGCPRPARDVARRVKSPGGGELAHRGAARGGTDAGR